MAHVEPPLEATTGEGEGAAVGVGGTEPQKPPTRGLPGAHSVHLPLNTPLAFSEQARQLFTPAAQQ